MVSSLPLLPEAPSQEWGLELGGVGGACCLEPRRIPSYILSLSLSLTLYKVLSTVFNPAIVLGASYTVTKKKIDGSSYCPARSDNSVSLSVIVSICRTRVMPCTKIC